MLSQDTADAILQKCVQSSQSSHDAAGYKMTAATAQKRLPLLMSSLHGLTKYAHLIDVEYFADLLQVHRHACDIYHFCAMYACSRNPRLQCSVCVIARRRLRSGSLLHCLSCPQQSRSLTCRFVPAMCFYTFLTQLSMSKCHIRCSVRRQHQV